MRTHFPRSLHLRIWSVLPEGGEDQVNGRAMTVLEVIGTSNHTEVESAPYTEGKVFFRLQAQ